MRAHFKQSPQSHVIALFPAAFLIAFALLTTAASAATKAPKLYKGTITATEETTIRIPYSGQIEKVEVDKFEITGLKFKRIKNIGRSLIYVVTGGTVHWTRTETGVCNSTTEATFAMKEYVNNLSEGYHLRFSRKKIGAPWKMYSMLGFRPSAAFPTTRFCTYGDGTTGIEEDIAFPATLLEDGFGGPGVLKQAPKSRISRTFKISSTSENGSLKRNVKLSIGG